MDIRHLVPKAPTRTRVSRLLLRRRQAQANKSHILAARATVVLVGLSFAATGAMLMAAGFMSAAWGLAVAGGLIVPVCLALVWSGIAPTADNLCNPPVAFVAEFFTRIWG